MPHAASRPTRDTARYMSVQNRHPRAGRSEKGEVANYQRGVRCLTMVHYRNIAEPLQCFIGRGRLHKHKSNCRFAAAESFNFRLTVSGPISGSRRRQQPCLLHVGPVAMERLHLGNGFMPLPDLGSPMVRHANDNPTR
jgi:hypothetical protein